MAKKKLNKKIFSKYFNTEHLKEHSLFFLIKKFFICDLCSKIAFLRVPLEIAPKKGVLCAANSGQTFWGVLRPLGTSHQSLVFPVIFSHKNLPQPDYKKSPDGSPFTEMCSDHQLTPCFSHCLLESVSR